MRLPGLHAGDVYIAVYIIIILLGSKISVLPCSGSFMEHAFFTYTRKAVQSHIQADTGSV